MVIRYRFPDTVDDFELQKQRNHPAVKAYLQAMKENPELRGYPTSFRVIIQDWENQEEIKEKYWKRIADRENTNPPAWHAERVREFFFASVLCFVIALVSLGVGIRYWSTPPPIYPSLISFLPTVLIPLFGWLAYRCNKEKDNWQQPYELASLEFTYKPILKEGIEASIRVEYQFPTVQSALNVLQRLNAAALAGLNRAFAQLDSPPSYDKTKTVLQEAIELEVQRLNLHVFRVRILEILPPPHKEKPKPPELPKPNPGEGIYV